MLLKRFVCPLDFLSPQFLQASRSVVALISRWWKPRAAQLQRRCSPRTASSPPLWKLAARPYVRQEAGFAPWSSTPETPTAPRDALAFRPANGFVVKLENCSACPLTKSSRPQPASSGFDCLRKKSSPSCRRLSQRGLLVRVACSHSPEPS